MLKNCDCVDDECKGCYDDNGKNCLFYCKFLVFINGYFGKFD